MNKTEKNKDQNRILEPRNEFEYYEQGQENVN